ncbi:unnamed protein product [Vitrella brassicaformis CCMP3155]|uniref:Mechanosensitive ion channel MscS domain-containing protein n=2 Tax=Vitrella brassicaformis TaxID=1169539 RepID=A0A0G4G119_VITBC|nr:unnamed protein product [Vitrella brassicaformis CCMP3155]|eukprot:CEM21676.1 unnamed protein product [Vitrella brassicaformis CCMP3155]
MFEMTRAFDSDDVLENVGKPFVDRDLQQERERVRVLRQITRHLTEGTTGPDNEPARRPSPPSDAQHLTPTTIGDRTASGGQQQDTPNACDELNDNSAGLHLASPSFGSPNAPEPPKVVSFAQDQSPEAFSSPATRIGVVSADNLEDSVSRREEDMRETGSEVNKSQSHIGRGGFFPFLQGKTTWLRRQDSGAAGATDAQTEATDGQTVEEEDFDTDEEEGDFERKRRLNRTMNRVKRLLSACKVPNLCSGVLYLLGVVALFVMGLVLNTSYRTVETPESKWLFLLTAILVARMASFLSFGLLVAIMTVVDPDADLPSSLVIETLHEHCARVLWFLLSLITYAVMFSCKTFASNCKRPDDGEWDIIEMQARRYLRVGLLSLLIMSLLSIVREVVMTWVSIHSNTTRNRQLQLLVWKERAFSRLNRVVPELHLHLRYDFRQKGAPEAVKSVRTRRNAAKRHRTGWTSRVPVSAAVEGPVGSSAASSTGGDGLGVGLSGPAPTAWESWRHRSYVILHPIRFHLRGVGRVEITRKREVREYGNQLFTQLLEIQAKLIEENRLSMESFAIFRPPCGDTAAAAHEQRQRGDDGGASPQTVSYNIFGRELIRQYITSPEDAERLLLLLDPSGTGRVTRSRFLSALLAAYNERKQLLKSLEVDESVADILKSLLWMLQWCIIIITVLWLLGVNPYTTILGFASISAGVAFALGNSIKNFVDSLVFVFIQHPFDIGDRVSVDGDVAMNVRRISVMTTTFETIHNKKVVLPNFQLAIAKIINETKSPAAVFEILFQLSIKTSMEQFFDLKRSVIEYCCSLPAHWISNPPPDMHIYSFQPNHSFQVGLWVAHTMTWGEWQNIYPARTRLFWHLMQTLDKLGLEYVLPIQPYMIVNASKSGENNDQDTSLSHAPSPDINSFQPTPRVQQFFLPHVQENRHPGGQKD